MITEELIEELKKYPGMEVKTYPKSQFEPEIKTDLVQETTTLVNGHAVSCMYTGKFKKILELRL